ncbi:hypothetical protein [Paucibacter sp. XJ19-41]|uniref:hypothetical protein n=1 Tax=Paucibacter sp. XJ19-41 TaxID=2927824 RepID=UPI002349F2E7|nr:hypothetical protein [Paucibacter sp. XJ19-41]MDC6166882.1 hypothetical protein [Paucibacter sp. XJ19-41]
MNKLTAVIALALLSTTGAAMARGGAFNELGRDSDVSVSAAAPQTRAAVLAELQKARGALDRLNSESYAPQISTVSTKSRAEVLAELQQARASGELALLNSEHADFAYGPQIRPLPQTLAGQPRSAQ